MSENGRIKMPKGVASKTPAESCAGQSKAGRCGAHPMKGSRFCFFHNPEKEAERTQARRRGAAVTNGLAATPLAVAMPPGLCSIAELMQFVETILRACASNDLDHRLAATMGGLIRIQAGLLVDYQLEDRVEALEKALEREGGEHG